MSKEGTIEDLAQSQLLRHIEDNGYSTDVLKYGAECIRKGLEMAHDGHNIQLSPIESEREWQEELIRKIWPCYPNESFPWQYLNGLIAMAHENVFGVLPSNDHKRPSKYDEGIALLQRNIELQRKGLAE